MASVLLASSLPLAACVRDHQNRSLVANRGNQRQASPTPAAADAAGCIARTQPLSRSRDQCVSGATSTVAPTRVPPLHVPLASSPSSSPRRPCVPHDDRPPVADAVNLAVRHMPSLPFLPPSPIYRLPLPPLVLPAIKQRNETGGGREKPIRHRHRPKPEA